MVDEEAKILEFRLRDRKLPRHREIDVVMPGGVPEGFVLLTHKRVIRVAAKMFECSEASFSARCRFPEAVLRRTAVVLALRKLSLSLPEIGRVLKRHHTTILSLERRGLADPRVAAAAAMIVELATTP